MKNVKPIFTKTEKDDCKFCNCCRASVIHENPEETNLNYYEINLDGICVFLCQNCLDELKKTM